jgi:hypothetical protein
MRLPDPSTLELGFPLVGIPPEASPQLSPNYLFPPCPTPPTQTINTAPPTYLTIPPYDPTLHETPTQYARRFDDVLYPRRPWHAYPPPHTATKPSAWGSRRPR